MRFAVFAFLILAFSLTAENMTLDGVHFVYRVPKKYDAHSRIMVLFGGRSWLGDKTLNVYHFEALADKHNLILLSPSFKDRDYWEPSKWSGNALKRAVSKLEKRYSLKVQKLYFYGYSAGGQCAALFYDWMPERVAAWGVHACGIYPENIKNAEAPALITCGREDAERFQISRHFLYRYREAGGELLWKPFPDGHELNQEALELARAWFDAILSGEKSKMTGEDDAMQVRDDIDIEFRNPLYSDKIRELWLK